MESMLVQNLLARSGRALGAVKTAARKTGVDLDRYIERVAGGEKWCTGCGTWQARNAFVADRSRWDGVSASCLESKRGRPRGRRDPDRELARRAVAVAVRFKKIPRPNELACVDCGHTWIEGERRHEYDHYLGYDVKSHLDVQPVCTTCHADREKTRRG